MNAELLHSLCSVTSSGSTPLYGGSQMLSPDPVIHSWGCGAVAVLELLMYLSKYHGYNMDDIFGGAVGDGTISVDDYNNLLEIIRKKYVPLLPHFGTNGVFLAAGINAAFRSHHIPLHARWGLSGRKIFDEITSALVRDIPVIISIGPNFPIFWEAKNVQLYSGLATRGLEKNAFVKAHYLIVTGIDDEYLTVSSWGRKYYISRSEYSVYAAKNSTFVLSNIVIIK